MNLMVKCEGHIGFRFSGKLSLALPPHTTYIPFVDVSFFGNYTIKR